MERLNERLALARKALSTLAEVPVEHPSAIQRDAAIQRFEYSFEAGWKAAQLYLRVHEGTDVTSRKAVIRAADSAKSLSPEQTSLALAMADDRNLTVHTYNEGLADLIYSRLPGHHALMAAWLGAMQSALQPKSRDSNPASPGDPR